MTFSQRKLMAQPVSGMTLYAVWVSIWGYLVVRLLYLWAIK